MTEVEIYEAAIRHIEEDRPQEALALLRQSKLPQVNDYVEQCDKLTRTHTPLQRKVMLKTLKSALETARSAPAAPPAEDGALTRATCPNPACGTTLKLARVPAAGKKVRCPKCETSFAVEAPAAPTPTAVTAEPANKCPSCKAEMAADAVVRIHCGVDRRTGKKHGVKKSPKRRPKKAREGRISADEVETLLVDAEDVLALAREEMDAPLPILAGIADDPVTFLLRGSSRILRNRCANPLCKDNILLKGVDDTDTYRSMLATVRFTCRGKTVQMSLCYPCSQQFKEEVAGRQSSLRTFLEHMYEELCQAAKEYPHDKRLTRQIRAYEMLAAENGLTLGRKWCFIATAAYGSPWAEEVAVLRCFRDDVLLRSDVGRFLVQLYEALSPPLAALVRSTALGRVVVRGLLWPIVRLCEQWLARRQPERIRST